MCQVVLWSFFCTPYSYSHTKRMHAYIRLQETPTFKNLFTLMILVIMLAFSIHSPLRVYKCAFFFSPGLHGDIKICFNCIKKEKKIVKGPLNESHLNKRHIFFFFFWENIAWYTQHMPDKNHNMTCTKALKSPHSHLLTCWNTMM